MQDCFKKLPSRVITVMVARPAPSAVIANEEVCRNVQFLELQLKKDMQYEGYVFRPLNIDSDLYALRTVNGPGSGEVTYADFALDDPDPAADSPRRPQYKTVLKSCRRAS